MNKKIIAILVFLIVTIGIGTASAFDLGSLMGGDSSGTEAQNITLDGIDFTIPAGFVEEESLAQDGTVNETDGLQYTTWGKTFSDDNNDVISIGVATYDGVEVTDDMPSYIGGDEATINGVDGYEYDVYPFEGFTYAKNGKLVILSVTNETLLDEVIIGE